MALSTGSWRGSRRRLLGVAGAGGAWLLVRAARAAARPSRRALLTAFRIESGKP